MLFQRVSTLGGTLVQDLPGVGFLIVALALGLFWAPALQAAIINVPGDEPTIQAGIDAANFGDEVVVADGTYTGAGNRDLSLTVHITVRSASGDPSLCIIDCQNSGRGFLINGVVSVARVEGFTIKNGTAANGGGIAFDNASPIVENCWIIDNQATVTGGGGISLQNNSSPTVVRCVIAGNLVNGFAGGAGIWNDGGDPQFTNCTVSGNTTSGIGVVGGAMRNTNGGQAVFTNCSLSANNAYDATALYTDGTGSATTLVNCIVWGHGAGTSGVVIQDQSGGSTTITYSAVQQGFGGNGNINQNPGFVDFEGPDSVVGTADDDLRISKFSPCTDAGNNSAPGLSGVTTDFAGNARFFDDTNVVDTGSGTAPLVDMGAYERQEASVNVAILVPGDASTIQAGIDLAGLGDHVVLADMTFTGGGNKGLVIDKDITVRSMNGDPNNCVIDCQGSGRAVTFSGVSTAATLQGIAITGGSEGEGGGVLFDNSSGTINGCKITGNTSTATGGGGVMIKNSSDPHLVNTTFISNSTSGIGVVGGALYVKGGSTPAVENCTFYQNSAYDATAMYSIDGGTVTTLVNCIVWSHGPGTSGVEIQSQSGAVTSITYSNIEGGFTGTGNINSNPIFADGDLRLASISPCVDVGDNESSTVSTDYDGNPRIFDGDGDITATVDMGPFEYGSSSSVGVLDEPAAGGLRLLPAWPNPARADVHVAFSLATEGPVSLTVFDLAGRPVRTLVNRTLSEGTHLFTWDGHDAAGRKTAVGVYLLRLVAEGESRGQKILKVR
jgi:hypothetical protein